MRPSLEQQQCLALTTLHKPSPKVSTPQHYCPGNQASNSSSCNGSNLTNHVTGSKFTSQELEGWAPHYVVEKQLARLSHGTAWKADNELNWFLDLKIVLGKQKISSIGLLLLSTS